VKVVDFFARDIHTFWATTFQFDLKLFDQFLLRRLGERPLNAVVLCDQDNLTAELSNLTEFDVRVAASANRRYLLRGIAPPSGGRFHPKTYFLASRRRAVLLVGSGNLTRSGVDRGREVFVAYDATDAKHAGVVQAWSRWIGELVMQAGDGQLRRRYERLRDAVPAPSSAAADEEFVTNAAASLLPQIVSAAPAPVAELHLSAPYFDREATAVGEVARALSPRARLKLYLGARPSVDGPALRDTLGSLGVPAEVYRFDPPKFVHAKLIGAVAEDGRGLLACGSANLSHAALTRTYSQPGSWGNCEAIVLRRGSADEVRAVFALPDATVVAVDLAELDALSFEEEPPATAWPVRLVSAERGGDRRIRVATEAELPEGLAVTWYQADTPLVLDQEGASCEQVPEGVEPLIVWLADGNGRPQSNRVVLDDPTALEAMLGERGGRAERPVELVDEDERSDLVALLAWTHRRFVFDVDDTAAARKATNAQEETDADETGFSGRGTCARACPTTRAARRTGRSRRLHLRPPATCSWRRSPRCSTRPRANGGSGSSAALRRPRTLSVRERDNRGLSAPDSSFVLDAFSVAGRMPLPIRDTLGSRLRRPRATTPPSSMCSRLSGWARRSMSSGSPNCSARCGQASWVAATDRVSSTARSRSCGRRRLRASRTTIATWAQAWRIAPSTRTPSGPDSSTSGNPS
jgi:hypothetical protein